MTKIKIGSLVGVDRNYKSKLLGLVKNSLKPITVIPSSFLISNFFILYQILSNSVILLISIDDVTAMIAGHNEQPTPMNKEIVEMFQEFVKKVIEQAGAE